VMGELSASGERGAQNCLRPGMWVDGLSEIRVSMIWLDIPFGGRCPFA